MAQSASVADLERVLHEHVERQHLARGEPGLSVDTKKKERVGNFKRPGRTWRPTGQPAQVNSSD